MNSNSNADGVSDLNDSKSPDTYRFRVNRINSVAAGCHIDQIHHTIEEEESDETLPYITSYPLETIPASPTSPTSSAEDSSDLVSGKGRERSNSKINLIGRVTNNFNRKQSGGVVNTNMASSGNNSGPPPVVRKFSLAGILGRRKSSNLPDIEDFAQTNSTVGLYGKSLHQYTHDALPKMDNYRHMMSFNAQQRPTIDELREARFRSPQKVYTIFYFTTI